MVGAVGAVVSFAPGGGLVVEDVAGGGGVGAATVNTAVAQLLVSLVSVTLPRASAQTSNLWVPTLAVQAFDHVFVSLPPGASDPARGVGRVVMAISHDPLFSKSKRKLGEEASAVAEPLFFILVEKVTASPATGLVGEMTKESVIRSGFAVGLTIVKILPNIGNPL